MFKPTPGEIAKRSLSGGRGVTLTGFSGMGVLAACRGAPGETAAIVGFAGAAPAGRSGVTTCARTGSEVGASSSTSDASISSTAASSTFASDSGSAMSASINAAIGSTAGAAACDSIAGADGWGCGGVGRGGLADCGGDCAKPKSKWKSPAGAAGACGAADTGGTGAGVDRETDNAGPSAKDRFSLTGVRLDGMRTGAAEAGESARGGGDGFAAASRSDRLDSGSCLIGVEATGRPKSNLLTGALVDTGAGWSMPGMRMLPVAGARGASA